MEISLLKLRKLNNINSEIIIIIEKGGKQLILDSNYNDIPDYIFVNEIQVSKNKVVDLVEGKNIIKMIWNHMVTNCQYMFYYLKNIIEVDLSNFDSSKVITMRGMFYGCSGIKKINLTNLNTSLVTNMGDLFYNCQGLNSLDLSNFNTLSVISMRYLFYEDINLEYINFRNIETNSLIYMDYMFLGCSKLKYINLYSLKEMQSI